MSGVTLFGKRILFTNTADAKLAGVDAGWNAICRTTSARSARTKIAAACRQGSTSIMLNRDEPPVWLRITPQQPGFGGYQVADGGWISPPPSTRGRRRSSGRVGPIRRRRRSPARAPHRRPALTVQMVVLADYGQARGSERVEVRDCM